MKCIGFEKVRDGKYLKNYEITYLNRQGREKKYEIVSRRDLEGPQDLGKTPSGVSIVATQGERLLLLREFRMGVNRWIYNLCAGMVNPGETMEECIARELMEETGLQVQRLKQILPPSYAAVAISDTVTCVAFVETKGELSDRGLSPNEEIQAAFYTKEQVRRLLAEESFSSRAQLAAYFFAESGFPL